MAIFKCKMCGGQLEFDESATVVKCDYCESTQTLPTFDNEKKINLFNRANALRFNKEFDKASGIYESIVAEFPNEAEAYWGLCLCKYGIEYVDDPKTAKKIPTCHRTCVKSILEDDDFKKAIAKADAVSAEHHTAEAKEIDHIQKNIIAMASKMDPYDIFICYKETDDGSGARTEDSAIAQDIYTTLVEQGYKVFFARNTLRNLGGVGYEPYIYSALTTASVMIAIGTKPNYFDAVWVKNEWSRFIKMTAGDSSKALIACYKYMDAYELPMEFKDKQALDMGEVTFFNSLTNSISNIIKKKQKESAPTSSKSGSAAPSVDSLLTRAQIFLDDKNWDQALGYYERVLDIDPRNSRAYLGELCVEMKIPKFEALGHSLVNFDTNDKFKKARMYADDELGATITKVFNDHVQFRYDTACNKMEEGKRTASIPTLNEAAKLFSAATEHEPSRQKLSECNHEILEVGYSKAKAALKNGDTENARNMFNSIRTYKDSHEMIQKCNRIDDLSKSQKQANNRLQQLVSRINEEKSEISSINRERRTEIIWLAVLLGSILLAFIGSVLFNSSSEIVPILGIAPFVIAIIIRVKVFYASTLFSIIFAMVMPVVALFCLIKDIISFSVNIGRHNKAIDSYASNFKKEQDFITGCKNEINAIVTGA